MTPSVLAFSASCKHTFAPKKRPVVADSGAISSTWTNPFFHRVGPIMMGSGIKHRHVAQFLTHL
jgi:TPP-dependent indolepyruvate ferredoxin oxidoreductase alpha subunit